MKKKRRFYGWCEDEKVYTPVIPPCNEEFENTTVLGSQSTFDDAIESCVDHILVDNDWELENYQSYDKEIVNEGLHKTMYKVTLHFVIELDDDDEDEESCGEYPADIEIYISETTKYIPSSTLH